MDFSEMKDLEPRGWNDRADMWARIVAGLRQDPLASMLVDETREGLARAVAMQCVPMGPAPKSGQHYLSREKWEKGIVPGALYTLTLDVLSKSPLGGVLDTKATIHLAEVIRDAVFPASARERENSVCGAQLVHPDRPADVCRIRGEHDLHDWAEEAKP